MKYFLITVGFIISIVALIQLSRFILKVGQLSDYGQGFMVGNVGLLLIGIVFIAIGYRRGKSSS